MAEYISHSDERLFGKTDSETIQNAIFETEKDGCRCAFGICVLQGVLVFKGV